MHWSSPIILYQQTTTITPLRSDSRRSVVVYMERSFRLFLLGNPFNIGRSCSPFTARYRYHLPKRQHAPLGSTVPESAGKQLMASRLCCNSRSHICTKKFNPYSEWNFIERCCSNDVTLHDNPNRRESILRRVTVRSNVEGTKDVNALMWYNIWGIWRV